MILDSVSAKGRKGGPETCRKHYSVYVCVCGGGGQPGDLGVSSCVLMLIHTYVGKDLRISVPIPVSYCVSQQKHQGCWKMAF